MDVDLLIIGAGPKGIALAAKHFALARHHNVESNYLVIERDGIGAHWAGKLGYTDGKQTLVSPAEHDVGYPYKSFRSIPNGEDVDAEMQKLSWESFLVAKGIRDEWVVKKRHSRPTHVEFVEYLEWVAAQIDLKFEIGAVRKIDIQDNFWIVEWEKCGNFVQCRARGLLITGHGGPKRIGGKGYSHPKITDGRDFWLTVDTFNSIMPGNIIGVVGAGETAGTIASAILDIIEKNREQMTKPVPPEIMLICKQPGYFLRSDVAKDLSHFSDPLDWGNLTDQNLKVAQRLGIIKRADRGVVSNHVKKKLEECDFVSYHIGKLELEQGDDPTSGKIRTEITYGLDQESEETVPQKFDFLVSALGFDDLWFFKLFTTSALHKLLDHLWTLDTPRIQISALNKKLQRERLCIGSSNDLVANWQNANVLPWLQKKLEFVIDADLAVEGFRPWLHLPRLSGLMQGPGFPNLNCLGLLSDRVWARYEPRVTHEEIEMESYFRWKNGDGSHGSHLENWYQSKKELRDKKLTSW